MTQWISDWLGTNDNPPDYIYAPRASNKSVKSAKSDFVYISSIKPMSVGNLMEDKIFWGESIIYSEDIDGCELIYERVQNNLYKLIKNFIKKKLSRQQNINIINKYRNSIMMRPLNDKDWSDQDLEIERNRLNL